MDTTSNPDVMVAQSVSGCATARTGGQGERTALRLLSLNADLPIFPGGGGVEYLTMTRLAARMADVGLVSLVHTRHDLHRSAGLVGAGVRLYLWESPWLNGGPAPPAPSVVRRLHRWLVALVEWVRANPRDPADTRTTRAAFNNMAPGLLQAMSERPWQILSIVQSSAAGMLDLLPQPLVSVLVMHDIRAQLYERRAATADSRTERRALEREANRYRRFEAHYCKRFDLVTAVSDKDADWIREHYRPSRVVTVPLPVDADHFSPSSVDEVGGRIVFTGLMNHPPNIDAARFFALDVLPQIRARYNNVEFHVVGRNPGESVMALARQPGVRVFGDVPDIRIHIAEASVVVVPLRYGSGARQKILEAWAMEKCVVSTAVGAEGLEYSDGDNILIARNATDLGRLVTAALEDPLLRDQVRTGGRLVARRFHAPEVVADRYLESLREVVASKQRVTTPMRILLDMRWMVPGLAGGIENLARAFVGQLAHLDPYNHYTMLVPAQSRYDLDGARRPNLRTVAVDSLPAIAGRLWTRARRRLASEFRLPERYGAEVQQLGWFRKIGAEIAYSFPGYIHPQLYGLRHVLVMPDIQHEYVPTFFAPAALEERRRLYTDSAHRADHICAISEFTRQTLIDKLGIPGAKITTVPLAADELFCPPSGPLEEADDARALEALGLTQGSYLFYPGHTWLHKNHRTAIEALRILRDRHERTPTLVCTGGPREAQPAINAAIASANLDAQVRFLGYRPRRELRALYRGAACLVFPSLFEGFGMPVLEAMASGCPVVCSNTTSLPEIAGDAAVLVDPADAEALAGAVARVLTDPDLRHCLRLRGFDRAPIFSWRRHTLETISVLRQVHERMRQA